MALHGFPRMALHGFLSRRMLTAGNSVDLKSLACPRAGVCILWH